tara:strand:- start:710 stop:1042 length:333 start_codon:yes stop_codon:yes gene_type:complete
MKYLIIVLISLVLCKDELQLYKESLKNKSMYDSRDYTKKNHGIKSITTEYTNGYKHVITYYNNGFLKSKGLYKNDLKARDWKTCDQDYNCICEYYDNSGVGKIVSMDKCD